jgi:hypothetical protein
MANPFAKMSKEEAYLANIQIEAVALGVEHLKTCLGVDAKMAKGMFEEFFNAGMVEMLHDDLAPAVQSAAKRVASMKGCKTN